jgi:hypothetical protein
MFPETGLFEVVSDSLRKHRFLLSGIDRTKNLCNEGNSSYRRPTYRIRSHFHRRLHSGDLPQIALKSKIHGTLTQVHFVNTEYVRTRDKRCTRYSGINVPKINFPLPSTYFSDSHQDGSDGLSFEVAKGQQPRSMFKSDLGLRRFWLNHNSTIAHA